MNIKIAAVCDNPQSGEILKEACAQLGISVNYEVQNHSGISRRLSNEIIQSSNVVLFVTEKEIEQIEEIERFIDREFYEVLPEFIISDAKNVISEITVDLN